MRASRLTLRLFAALIAACFALAAQAVVLVNHIEVDFTNCLTATDRDWFYRNQDGTYQVRRSETASTTPSSNR